MVRVCTRDFTVLCKCFMGATMQQSVAISPRHQAGRRIGSRLGEQVPCTAQPPLLKPSDHVLLGSSGVSFLTTSAMTCALVEIKLFPNHSSPELAVKTLQAPAVIWYVSITINLIITIVPKAPADKHNTAQ